MDEGCEVDEVVVDFASEMLAMADSECVLLARRVGWGVCMRVTEGYLIAKAEGGAVSYEPGRCVTASAQACAGGLACVRA